MNKNIILSGAPLLVALCLTGLTACSGGSGSSNHKWNDANSAGSYQDNDSSYTQPHGYMCSSSSIMSTGCE